MEFASGGWPVWKGEFTPFGQELDTQFTANKYKFTGLEHDSESGLDHTQFRQYASNMGRWMSPDPYNGSYDLSNPQSFNRYSYVGNMPLNYTDPTGLDPFTISVLALCGHASGACAGAASNPVGAVALGAVFVGAVIADLFTGGFFAKPVFHGSLKPRPNTPNKSGCKTGFGAGITMGGDAGIGAGSAGAGANGSIGAGLFGGSGVNAGVFASGGAGANFFSHAASTVKSLISPNFSGLGGGGGVGIFLTNASQASQLAGPSATWNVDLGWFENGSAQFSQGADAAGNNIYTFSFQLGVGAGALYHNVTNTTIAKGTGKPKC